MIEIKQLRRRAATTHRCNAWAYNAWARWGCALLGLGLLVLAAPAHAIQLVTEQEAALPDNTPLPDLLRWGSPTRRPAVDLVSPPNNGSVVKSPLNLKVTLKPHGGAKIDKDSIVITYEKKPLIDLTQRLAPFITADGIEVPNAEIPPGTHKFRIAVKGTDGHPGGLDFTIQVAK